MSESTHNVGTGGGSEEEEDEYLVLRKMYEVGGRRGRTQGHWGAPDRRPRVAPFFFVGHILDTNALIGGSPPPHRPNLRLVREAKSPRAVAALVTEERKKIYSDD